MSIDRSGGRGIIFFFPLLFFSFFSFSIEFERTIEGMGRGEGKDRIFNLARIIEREREKEDDLWLMDSRWIIAIEINFYWYKA